jgi:hypothetical protein
MTCCLPRRRRHCLLAAAARRGREKGGHVPPAARRRPGHAARRSLWCPRRGNNTALTYPEAGRQTAGRAGLPRAATRPAGRHGARPFTSLWRCARATGCRPLAGPKVEGSGAQSAGAATRAYNSTHCAVLYGSSIALNPMLCRHGPGSRRGAYCTFRAYVGGCGTPGARGCLASCPQRKRVVELGVQCSSRAAADTSAQRYVALATVSPSPAAVQAARQAVTVRAQAPRHAVAMRA